MLALPNGGKTQAAPLPYTARTVALVDVGITEWRLRMVLWLNISSLLHSLMLALPNGGGKVMDWVGLKSVVALVDVGITEWRFGLRNCICV